MVSRYPTVGANDRLGSIGMAMGILAALVARERTGVGQHIHTSLLGWMLNLQAVGASIAANTGQDPRPTRREDANDPMYNFYRCRDGVWVALGMVIHKDKFWPQVCQALGDTELANDPRFATVELREQNRQELVKILDGLFGAIDYPEWERQATENDFISTRVNALTDLAQDPQVKANGYSPSCRTRTSANSPTWPRPWRSPKHRSRSAIARPRSVRTMSNCCRVGSA
jgi:crotonobetainyl-CoA:carnitine CoA-transferase CaiB-like acyl-CoA transferase